MKFAQIAAGKTYLGPKGVHQKVISISGNNEVAYIENGKTLKKPGQEFAKQATSEYRDRSHDKPKDERRRAA